MYIEMLVSLKFINASLRSDEFTVDRNLS